MKHDALRINLYFCTCINHTSMKHKLFYVLIALVLPVMVSCGGDDEDETPTISANHSIVGDWVCMKYNIDLQDQVTDNYYIKFTQFRYSTNMPCFKYGDGSYTYLSAYSKLKLGSVTYSVKVENVLEIQGNTPERKKFYVVFKRK